MPDPTAIVLRAKGNTVPDKDGKAIACFEPKTWWYLR